ncbi:MAG: hypothetical protein Q9196_004830 [Gyalolechia fulgens]
MNQRYLHHAQALRQISYENGLMITSRFCKLNTSMLGRLTVNTSENSDSLLNSIENSIKGEVNDLIADVARTLNIHDFYSAHLLNYCEVRARPR